MSNCVRCGGSKLDHCRADGSNIFNAACPAYLAKWPDESPPTEDAAAESLPAAEAEDR